MSRKKKKKKNVVKKYRPNFIRYREPFDISTMKLHDKRPLFETELIPETVVLIFEHSPSFQFVEIGQEVGGKWLVWGRERNIREAAFSYGTREEANQEAKRIAESIRNNPFPENDGW